MKILAKLLWLIKRNLIIDLKFVTRVDFVGKVEKLELFLAKYFTLIKHFFIPFKTGASFIQIHGKPIFYGTPYGLVGYNCMLAEQIFWLTKLQLTKSPAILDIGANMGYFTLGCKKLYPNARVYCFEPVPEAYEALVKNTADQSEVYKFNNAVGEANRQTKMDVNIKETSFSKISQNETNLSRKVEMIRLDDVEELKHEKLIDVLKIDVEGYELNVLKGAIETLKKTRYLLMELNSNAYSLSDIVEILNSADKKVSLKFVRNFELEQDTEFTNGDVLFELV